MGLGNPDFETSRSHVVLETYPVPRVGSLYSATSLGNISHEYIQILWQVDSRARYRSYAGFELVLCLVCSLVRTFHTRFIVTSNVP